jgi:hypothetical protein
MHDPRDIEAQVADGLQRVAGGTVQARDDGERQRSRHSLAPADVCGIVVLRRTRELADLPGLDGEAQRRQGTPDE